LAATPTTVTSMQDWSIGCLDQVSDQATFSGCGDAGKPQQRHAGEPDWVLAFKSWRAFH
jgi:hypothetical protein